MKEIDKLEIAANIVWEWDNYNSYEASDEKSEEYTDAVRALGAMHCLKALFNMRGEDAPPLEETFFSKFARGLANAMANNEKEQEEANESDLDKHQ